MPEPRCVHYQFAHVALRGLVFGDAQLAAALWQLDDPRRVLDDIAGQVAHGCRAQGHGGQLAVADLRVHKRRLGAKPCVVIELPRPIATAEAFMVAILPGKGPGEGPDRGAPEAEPSAARYFTLEFSAHREPPQTVLGEWTAQGSHLNMGAGPPPSVDAFVAALARYVLD